MLATGRPAGDHRGVPHAGALAHGPLHVLREHVQAVRGDDHLLLAPVDGQPAVGIESADVAGMEPAVPERGRGGVRSVVVPGGHVVAAYEDLSVVGNPDLDAGDRSAHGPAPRPKRVVEGDDGRRLGQAVALDDQEPESRPERLHLRIEGRRPDDERPELVAEQPVHPAVAPPAPRDVLAPLERRGDLGREVHDVVAQHLEDLRDADEHGHAAGPDLADDGGRVVAAHEDGDPLQHRRHEGRHGLPEHVAQGKQVQEAQRKEGPPVPGVLQDLALDRHDVGQHVRVRDPDSLGFGRGSRSEDDLGQVVAARVVRGVALRGIIEPVGHGRLGRRGIERGAVSEQLVERPGVDAGEQRRAETLARHDEPGRDDPHDAPDEFGRRAQVDRDGHRPRGQAAPEGDDPLGAVLAPQHHAVAGRQTVLAEHFREPPGGAADLVVGPGVGAIASVVDEERPGGTDAVVEEIE